MYLIWILESGLIRSNNQSRAPNSVCLRTNTIKLLDARIGHLRERNQCLPSHRSSFETYDVCEHHYQVAPIYLEHKKHFQYQKQLDPIMPEQANHLISVQCPKRWFQILLSCEKQEFVSCTSNLLEQMYDCRKCTVFFQKWISNLQDLPRNQSLETVPVCNVWQYYPHDNVGIHMCDECMKSINSGVCHRLWSVLWLIAQSYSLTR